MQMVDDATICPHCGQELSGDKLKEVIANFQIKKEMNLANLKAESLRIKGDQETKKKIIDSNEKILIELDAELEALNRDKLMLNEIISKQHDIEAFDDRKFNQQIDDLQEEISSFEDIDNSKLQEEINLANKDLQMIAIKLSKCDAYDKAVSDVAAKENELKEKQHSLADIEVELMNVEDFVTTKVRMLEEKVNSKFDNVKFKLFKQNQNGSTEETCIALGKAKNGALVDIKDSLANKALIYQAGVEIVNVLQRHFDFYCPVVIDNKESVTKVPGVEGQMLQLIVSETDEELRVE